MAKTLLVNVPFYRLLGSHYNANSLGIAYIAAFLNSMGHNAWLYNADFVNRDTYLRLKGIFGGFHDYKSHFENPDDEIWHEVVEKILEFKPDWVGYTSYTANVSAIDIISRKVAEREPNIKQVVGGVHATLDQNILQNLPAVDYAVRREGEYAMLRLVEGENPVSIRGVVSRGSGNGRMIDTNVNREIDGLPLPERRKFWGLTEEESRTVDVSYVCSIRGCPYRCNYCASPFHWKRDKTQFRSPESVLEEMRLLKTYFWNEKEYDFSASANTDLKGEMVIRDNSIVYFVDDVFTVRKKRVKEILRGMIDRRLDMPWKCEARTDHLDEEICGLMADAKCKRVKLGFESGSDRILKQIQKDETVEDMRRGAAILKEAGVPITAYFMAGFPGETDDDLKETIAFARELKADYYCLSVLSPYYGTKMYFDLMAEGYELDKKPWEYFYHQTGELMVNDKISPKVLEEYLSLAEMNEGAGYV